MTREISLTKGYVALVDDEDFDAVSKFKWQALVQRRMVYAYRSVSGEGGRKTTVYLHRDIAGAAKGELVDHKNRNGLDCRKHNLRVCSRTQNNRNRTSVVGSSSKYLGVRKAGSAWEARINVGGAPIYLGRFADEQSAARAYDSAAVLHFGEFANPNFPAGDAR